MFYQMNSYILFFSFNKDIYNNLDYQIFYDYFFIIYLVVLRDSNPWADASYLLPLFLTWTRTTQFQTNPNRTEYSPTTPILWRWWESNPPLSPCKGETPKPWYMHPQGYQFSFFFSLRDWYPFLLLFLRSHGESNSELSRDRAAL